MDEARVETCVPGPWEAGGSGWQAPLWHAPADPFVAGEYRIRIAEDAWERAGHHALRRSVFVHEQGVFSTDDRDAIDSVALPIVATDCMLGSPHEVVGAVRIHEPEPGLWWGSRLAVHPAHRRVGRLGAELIRMAVCTATGQGATCFLAHVQTQNVPLFRRLRWRSLGEVSLHGRLHHKMEADLAHYRPHGLRETRLVRPGTSAASRAA